MNLNELAEAAVVGHVSHRRASKLDVLAILHQAAHTDFHEQIHLPEIEALCQEVITL